PANTQRSFVRSSTRSPRADARAGTPLPFIAMHAHVDAPAAEIEQAGLAGDVELHAEDGRIVIAAVPRGARPAPNRGSGTAAQTSRDAQCWQSDHRVRNVGRYVRVRGGAANNGLHQASRLWTAAASPPHY